MQEVSASSSHPVDTAMDDLLNDGCATPEEPESFNRIKAPPVCVDLSLKQESMSTEILRQWIFPESATFPAVDTGSEDFIRPESLVNNLKPASDANLFPSTTSSAQSSVHVPVSVISVSSNTSSGDSYNLSSDETSDFKLTIDAAISNTTSIQPPLLNRDASERLNAKVLLRKTSRQGRSSQRWASGASILAKINIADSGVHSPGPNGESLLGGSFVAAPISDPVIRLVTGCVPILQSGKILFVSASRKAAWILPKGGWEQDESMEESAIRECFEEAGCIGTLGHALSPVHYETRKAKKRRVENETANEKEPGKVQSVDTIVETWLNNANSKTDDNASTNSGSNEIVNSTISIVKDSDENAGCFRSSDINSYVESPANSAVPCDSMTRIPQLGWAHTDTETMSVGSTLSGAYTHVQMTLFPLYVQKIEDDWPEKGRFRKAVHIDEAIKMMEERPELQAALVEVRNRKLHLVCDAITPAEESPVPN